MAKLYCALCKETIEESEFTNFKRNPKLADRNGNCPICKDCASAYVSDRGNTKEALKEALRLQDIPYLENFANSAMDSFEKKKKNTNLVTKKNMYDETEEVSSIETTKHQNTIYTCYSSKLGLMPKKYIDFSFSDGIRDNAEYQPQVVEPKVETKDDDKTVQSAIRYLIKTFTKEIFDDKARLAKAVELKCQELSLHKNNTNTRQAKFKLKNHIVTLIDVGELIKNDFSFIYGEDDENKPKDGTTVDAVEVDTEFKVPIAMDIEKLKDRWGDDYKPQELVKFEKKYLELRKNYEIKTASHDEFLKNACVASVKANECMARNQADESKLWFGIFKDMTSAGKLQPSQMSKADLSGGLNNFSEFFKTVEQSRNVIEILPEMYETPRDKADFVVFCLVQYVRRLKGLPDVDYKDIYKFYEEMEAQFVDDDDIDFDSFFDEEGELNG